MMAAVRSDMLAESLGLSELALALPPISHAYVMGLWGQSLTFEHVVSHDFRLVHRTLSPFGTTATELRDIAQAVREALSAREIALISHEVRGRYSVIQLRVEATHSGAWFGVIRPTSRRVQMQIEHRLVLRDGQIERDEIDFDVRALFRQLRENKAAPASKR